jgi:cytochrome c5
VRGGADGFDVVDAAGRVVVHGAGVPRAAIALGGALGASLGTGGALIATDTTLFALTTTPATPALVVSALDGALDPVVDLAQVGDTLWLATTTGLFRYDATHFDELRLAGQRLPSAHLTAPVAVDGATMLVAGTARGLFAIANEPTLRVLDLGVADAVSVAADVDGGLWVVTGGRVLQRYPWGVWAEWLFADDVVAVAAARHTRDVWLTVGDRLVHARDGSFRGAGAAPTSLTATVDGAAVVVVGADGAHRLREGRSLRIDALREAEVLLSTSTVTVRALPRGLGATLVVTLDGVASGAPTAGETTLSVDPTTLSPGVHRLTATATYPDGDRHVVERDFFAQTAAFPTWRSDVQPVFDAVCSACHTPAGGAHLLNGSDLWRGEINQILRALEPDPATGFAEMPHGDPLSEDDRRRIRLWAATGMQE